MNNLHTISSIQFDLNNPTEFKFSFSVAVSAFNEGIFVHSAATEQYNLYGQFSRSAISLMNG